MVDLTAQNMLATASRNRREWGEELTRILATSGVEYVVRLDPAQWPLCMACDVFLMPSLSLLLTTQMVTSTQLVGVCLYIFCHPSHVAFVRDVAVADVKTGAGGKVGNKGAVGVHLRFYNTRSGGL